MSRSPSQASISSGTSPTEKAERRIGQRYRLTASAEVTDLNSGARFSARISDLSKGGCFVDTLAPLPQGARVRLCISRGEQVFEAVGKVVYFQEGLGMGIAFAKVQPDQRPLLDTWLLEVSGERPKDPARAATYSGETPADLDRALVVKLIHLLIARGVLTEEDGRSLLRDPLL